MIDYIHQLEKILGKVLSKDEVVEVKELFELIFHDGQNEFFENDW